MIKNKQLLIGFYPVIYLSLSGLNEIKMKNEVLTNVPEKDKF
jgi:hypothetical protein